MAVGQHQWYTLGVGAPPILVYFSGDWDDWGYGVLTHSHVSTPMIGTLHIKREASMAMTRLATSLGHWEGGDHFTAPWQRERV